MWLKTSTCTASHPPHSSSAARTASVRALRRVAHSPAAGRISAAGSSQETWPPITRPNIRPQPASWSVLPSPPTSSPFSRPSPL